MAGIGTCASHPPLKVCRSWHCLTGRVLVPLTYIWFGCETFNAVSLSQAKEGMAHGREKRVAGDALRTWSLGECCGRRTLSHSIACTKAHLECDQYLTLPTLDPGRTDAHEFGYNILLPANIHEWVFQSRALPWLVIIFQKVPFDMCSLSSRSHDAHQQQCRIVTCSLATHLW